MRKLLIPAILIITATLILGCVSTQEKSKITPPKPSKTEIITKIKEEYNKIKTLEGNISLSIGNSTPVEMKFWLKKPDKYRLEGKAIYIHNGSNNWLITNGKVRKYETDIQYTPDYGFLLYNLNLCNYTINDNTATFYCNRTVNIGTITAFAYKIAFNLSSYLPKEIDYYPTASKEPLRYAYHIKRINHNIDDSLFQPPKNVNATPAPLQVFKSWDEVSTYLNRKIPYPTYTANETLNSIIVSALTPSNIITIKATYQDFVVYIVIGEHPVKPGKNVVILKNNITANYIENGNTRALLYTIGEYNIAISGKLPKDVLIKIANSTIRSP